jgi:hypothetical protein
VNFDKFKLECKMGRRLGKNEVVDYKDRNPLNRNLENLTVKVVEENKLPKVTILAHAIDDDYRVARSYTTIAKASKETGVSSVLIKASLNEQVDKVKGNNSKWYSFKYVDTPDVCLQSLTALPLEKLNISVP